MKRELLETFYMQTIIDNQNMINFILTLENYKVVYLSQYTARRYPDLKVGDICYEIIAKSDKPCENCPIYGLIKGKKRNSVEYYDESLHTWYSVTATLTKAPDGTQLGLICGSNISDYLEKINAIDYLTGVLSFAKFEMEAIKILCDKKNSSYVLISMDINKFKYINDEYGFEIGDEVLKKSANYIYGALNQKDLLCRINGDNFIIFKKYHKQEDVIHKINEIFKGIEAMYKKSFLSLNIILVCGLYFLDEGDEFLSVAIDKANLAKKNIKGFHKNILSVYGQKLHEQVVREQQIELNMLSALENKEFVVYLQPKVELSSKKIIGAEGLVRWKESDGNLMEPSEFIPIFERNGFALELDFYVYEEMFKIVNQWIIRKKKPIVISLNVSRVHLNNENFMYKLDSLVKKYNIDTSFIELELTENIIFNDWERFVVFTNQLRDRGFLISIDDFGSGFSSLNLLAKLPVDILKIDKEFFLGNGMNQRNGAVIRSVIQLANGLGIKVISEGVETKEQEEFLMENGCDIVQGFRYFKPLPVSEFEKLLLEDI